jgi:hypothetical protein
LRRSYVPVILGSAAEHNPKERVSIVKKSSRSTFDRREASGLSQYVREMQEGTLHPKFALLKGKVNRSPHFEISPKLDAEKMGLLQQVRADVHSDVLGIRLGGFVWHERSALRIVASTPTSTTPPSCPSGHMKQGAPETDEMKFRPRPSNVTWW